MFLTHNRYDDDMIRGYRSDNYVILDNKACDNNLCYIFCSSNGLYTINDLDSYNKMIKKKRFEYQNIAKGIKARKIIFLRDIWLSWYALGINYRLNNIDKMLYFIEEETDGLEIIAVGTSSGGYLASIIGSKLKNVTIVFSNCGQYSLYNHNDHVLRNPILSEGVNVPKIEKYYDIYNDVILGIRGGKSLYYFYPERCKHDIIQKEYLISNNKDIHIIGFDSRFHGVTVNNFDWPAILAMSALELDAMFDIVGRKAVDSNCISMYINGKAKGRYLVNKHRLKTQIRSYLVKTRDSYKMKH